MVYKRVFGGQHLTVNTYVAELLCLSLTAMGPLAFSVLRLLNDGKLHSIDYLAQSLKVSQSRIQKTLDEIDQYGVILNKTSGLGIQWPEPLNWLDVNEIISNFPQANLPFYLIILDSIDSTNRFLLDQVIADSNCLHGNPVIITELQTQGRGRLGRRWYSGLGDSLTFSLSWRFDCPVRLLSGLSLVTGVAIIRALTHFGIKNLSLKWPNDVLFHSRKLAGILIELCSSTQSGSAVVIGIGLNIQLSPLAKSNIDQAFVDLFAITGRAIDRNQLLAVLLSELAGVLNKFNHLGFSYFRNEWLRYHAYEGQLITINLPDGRIIKGVVDGVELDGSITLNLESGKKESYSSGEITLRSH